MIICLWKIEDICMGRIGSFSHSVFGMNNKGRVGEKNTGARTIRLGEFWIMMECSVDGHK